MCTRNTYYNSHDYISISMILFTILTLSLLKASCHTYIMYKRQIALSQFGQDGQSKLANGKVYIIGCGGLGNAVAIYLASSGVNRIHLVDHDKVSLSNLHRQVAYTHDDIGFYKAQVLAREIRRRNPDCEVTFTLEPFEHADDNILGFDVMVDCSDNAKTRLLCNRVTLSLGIPLVFGSAIGWDGQLFVVQPKIGPCLECVFPEMRSMTDRCTLRGVLGPVPNTIGVLQATMVIRCLLGMKIEHELVLYSANTFQFTSIAVEKDEECRECGTSKEEAVKESDMEVSYEEYLQKSVKEDVMLLDIRHEVLEEIMNSIWVDERYIKIPEDRDVYVVCEYGDRSLEVVRRFRKKGFGNVYSIKGGIVGVVRDE